MIKKITPTSKSVVVYNHKPYRAIVIIATKNKDEYFCRLPLVKELAQINSYIVNTQPLAQAHTLVKTTEDVSPWDLLDPFPPDNYYDYGYLELDNKKGDLVFVSVQSGDETKVIFWETLSEEDKKLIEQANELFNK